MDKDWSEFIPQDVLKKSIKSEDKITRRKQPYPSARDVVKAVIEAAKMAKGIHPHDFPYIVIEILKSNGFNTKHVKISRIWRTYEALVRRGIISDTLHVVEY